MLVSYMYLWVGLIGPNTTYLNTPDSTGKNTGIKVSPAIALLTESIDLTYLSSTARPPIEPRH